MVLSLMPKISMIIIIMIIIIMIIIIIIIIYHHHHHHRGPRPPPRSTSTQHLFFSLWGRVSLTTPVGGVIFPISWWVGKRIALSKCPRHWVAIVICTDTSCGTKWGPFTIGILSHLKINQPGFHLQKPLHFQCLFFTAVGLPSPTNIAPWATRCLSEKTLDRSSDGRLFHRLPLLSGWIYDGNRIARA